MTSALHQYVCINLPIRTNRIESHALIKFRFENLSKIQPLNSNQETAKYRSTNILHMKNKEGEKKRKKIMSRKEKQSWNYFHQNELRFPNWFKYLLYWPKIGVSGKCMSVHLSIPTPISTDCFSILSRKYSVRCFSSSAKKLGRPQRGSPHKYAIIIRDKTWFQCKISRSL